MAGGVRRGRVVMSTTYFEMNPNKMGRGMDRYVIKQV